MKFEEFLTDLCIIILILYAIISPWIVYRVADALRHPCVTMQFEDRRAAKAYYDQQGRLGRTAILDIADRTVTTLKEHD